jgi:hypothetical protein
MGSVGLVVTLPFVGFEDKLVLLHILEVLEQMCEELDMSGSRVITLRAYMMVTTVCTIPYMR